MGPPRKRASSRKSNAVVAAQKKPRTNDSSEAPYQIAASGEYIEDNNLYAVKCKTESNETEDSSPDRINGEPSDLANASSMKDVSVGCLSQEKLDKIKHEQEESDIDQSFNQSADVNSNEPLQDQKWMKEEPDTFTPETEAKKARSYVCFCGKSYSCNSHLNRHRKIHAPEVPPPPAQPKRRVSEVKPLPRGFVCKCGRQYTRRSNLKRHQVSCTEHVPDTPVFDTPVPDTPVPDKHVPDTPVPDTPTESDVNCSNVEEPDEKVKPYVCPCGKSYTCSSHLYRHQRTHAEINYNFQNEKRYVCECGKSYSCSSHLYRHQRTHSEAKAVPEGPPVVEDPTVDELEKRIKPHLCFCGKRYTCTSHLYRHQKVHHSEAFASVRETPKVKVEEPEPEKRYQCDCGKSYTSSSHLYRHQRTHQMPNFTSESNDLDQDSEADFEECRQKPYKCECGKSFILSFSLLLHKKIHCRWKSTTD